ncbi:hypothetical protein PEL8287_02140 [Roseovarius litorisediminis]|uniref:Translocase n=2 Tax=Roseovarius litorisediminis TaxID=1312363 RepID=A0A1Y5SKI7_9RHOB|nr:hypothetical protein PEL8287_02140 [Roseovarius litorisediminis]
MVTARRLVTAGGTLVCALSIGYLMQSTSSAAPDPIEKKQIEPTAGRTLDARAADEILISNVVLTSAEPAPPKSSSEPTQFSVEKVASASVSPDKLDLEYSKRDLAPRRECKLELSATAIAAAMVKLNLVAPCLINQRFTVHHNGMMFSEVTNSDGNSVLTIPALTEQPVFIVSFPGGNGVVASTRVTSLENYGRAVVQWRGASRFHIHALEYAADYGDVGHVWADAPRDMKAAALGEGGYLTRLGTMAIDNPLLAEVYTFPVATAVHEGEVRLSIEAEVTNGNCGRNVEAQTLQIIEGSVAKAQEIVLAMPDCNAVGDFLVLKNTFNDMKIAQK